mgnify:CR=1 FL=1
MKSRKGGTFGGHARRESWPSLGAVLRAVGWSASRAVSRGANRGVGRGANQAVSRTASRAVRCSAVLGTAVVVALAVTACGSSATVPDSSGDPAASGLSGELTIFAAASLTASFTELAADFHAENPGVTVKPISFDGSSTLATQLQEGAPADVFASADVANMDKVGALIDGPPELFASNVLQIAVQPGNPLGITQLSDLAIPGLHVVLCAPDVPCGASAHKLLELDGVTVKPASEEQNVSAVLTKVRLREADAGLVYITDVLAAAGAVDGVAIAGADRAFNSYPIATLAASRNPDAANAFVAYVLSPKGQAVLAKYGFSAP